MVIAFYNIYFGLLTICDWFFFLSMLFAIFLIFLRSQIVTLNVLLLIIAFKGSAF